MPSYDFLDVVRDMNAPDIDRPVLAHEAASAAHVVAVVGVFIPAKDVDIWIEEVVQARQTVQVLALMALGADASREEEAEVAPRDAIRLGVSGVLSHVAAALGGRLRQVLVLPVAARPLVIPDVEDRARLRRRFRRDARRVDLRSRRSPLSPYHLLHLALSRRRVPRYC